MLLNVLTDELGADKELLFLLSHHAAKDLIKEQSPIKRTNFKQAQPVAGVACGQSGFARNNITANEHKVLSHISFLGCVFRPRDYLSTIRQASS